jgi:hypothetical protein
MGSDEKWPAVARAEIGGMSKYDATKKRAYYEKNRERLLAYHKNRYAAIREVRKAESAEYRRKNPRAQYRARIKRLYGLTLAEYDALVAEQCGLCAICGQPPRWTTGMGTGEPKLHVDHDHETGEVRSLLCQKCNRGIGCFGDDQRLLMRALWYLQGHAAKRRDVSA